MTEAEMRTRLKQLLGRPSSDDFYSDPTEYYDALNEVRVQARITISNQYPNLLYEESGPVSSSDGGTTWPIPNNGEVIGRLRVFEPPGVRTGSELLPAVPGMLRAGFRVQGVDIKLTVPRNIDLYFMYISQDGTAIESGVDSDLPNFMDRWLVYKAAGIMALKAGSLVDPDDFEDKAAELWRGDPRNPMDSGIMGMLAQYAERQGWEGLDYQDDRWWNRLSN